MLNDLRYAVRNLASPRPDSARGRRGAARARGRAGGHAGHQGCGRRRRTAAEVHGELRDGAADRAGRLLHVIAGEPAPPAPEPQTDTHEGVTVEIGAPANPPGFDEQLAGLAPGESKTFDVTYPADYAIQELAGTTVKYSAALKAIRRRVVPELDDEFAKDVGDFETLDALRARVREDLEHEAKHEAERELRGDLLKQIASRVTFDVPAALLEREIDRRVEDFARRLMEQQIDRR